MKRGNTLIFVAGVQLFAACATQIDIEEEPELGEEEIVNGSADNPQTSAVGLLSHPAGGTCSASFIANDLALTSAFCEGTTAVDVSGNRVAVRVFRNMGATDVVALQLRGPVPLRGSTSGYSRGLDRTKLAIGDVVVCHGYDGGRLRRGSFEIVDMDSSQYFLAGRPNVNLVDAEVSREDRGGYCERDGSIAAILIHETDSQTGVAIAAATHSLDPAVADVRYAAEVARKVAAVKLRDDLAQRFITSDLAPQTVGARAQVPATDDRRQSFYLEKVATPPAGGTEWYRMVSAWDGRCLSAIGSTLHREACNRQRREQMFYLNYEQPNGAGRYRLLAVGGSVDADPTGGTAPTIISVAPSSRSPSQYWEMWLTRY
ncbi:MAG TPA: hypothetical protein VFU21_31930 [Kofleriaceae bacterium]|nr:hypothetical protein [Kofleriaceae bacterium]